MTSNDVAQTIPWIYVTLDNRHADHQTPMVEMKSMISNQLISIYINLVYNFIYVSPKTIKISSM